MKRVNVLQGRHTISIGDFTRGELELLIETAECLKTSPQHHMLNQKIVASCFYEPSTRTRLSFETAVQRLGGTVIGFSDAENTSTKKGETLSDTIRIISSYTDAIILRHPKEGAARLASECSKVPIINGGDGANQHPTQTLLDLFSIKETQRTLYGLKIAFVGDLKYGRTVHSLVQALSLFESHFYFVSPEALALPDYIYAELAEKGLRYSTTERLEDIVSEVDILYMTRIQTERLDETEFMEIRNRFVLKPELLRCARSNLKIMHPLPRVNEIPVQIDSTPYAYYFEQAENGIYARQALIALVLNGIT